MATPLECWCRSCGSRIEASPGHADPLECPYCGVGTPLAPTGLGRRAWLCRNRVVWLVVAAVGLFLPIAFGFWYRRFVLSGLDLVAEATGGRTSALLTLAGAFLLVVALLAWMLLPFVVYFGLKDLRRRTALLERTTRLCAHHLARASADRQQAKARSPARQSGADSD